MLGRPVRDAQIGEAVEHVVGSAPSGDDDRQTSACKLIIVERCFASTSTTSMRKAWPSSVRSWAKAYDQTWFGRSGRRTGRANSDLDKLPLTTGESWQRTVSGSCLETIPNGRKELCHDRNGN